MSKLGTTTYNKKLKKSLILQKELAILNMGLNNNHY